MALTWPSRHLPPVTRFYIPFTRVVLLSCMLVSFGIVLACIKPPEKCHFYATHVSVLAL